MSAVCVWEVVSVKRTLSAVIILTALLAGCGGDDATPSTASNASADGEGEEADVQPTADEAVDAEVDDQPEEAGLGDLEGGPPVDACSLLTLDEIEGVLGLPPSAGVTEEIPPPFYGCSWETDSFESVSVSVISWGSPDDARSSFDLFLGEVTEIDGIGDAALSNIVTDIAFIVDGFEVTIDVLVEADAATQQAQAQTLAPLVISRLP